MANYDTFVSALERSFDFHSARVVAKSAVKTAGLDDSGDWSDDDVKLAAASIDADGKDLTPVMVALGLEEAPAPAAAAEEPAAEEEEAAEEVAEEEEAEEEAPADDYE